MRDFKLIITGPKAYLPEGIRVEDISISNEELEEVMEDNIDPSSEDEAIQYILRERINEWEQGFCNAIVVTTESLIKLKELL